MRNVAIPVSVIRHYFSETFWAAHGTFARFGHRALRIAEQAMHSQPMKYTFTSLLRDSWEYEKVLVVPQFSEDIIGNWLMLKSHDDWRYGVLGDYLLSLTDRFVELKMMHRRLRDNKETWMATDREIQALADDMQGISTTASPHMTNYRETEGILDLEEYLRQSILLFSAAEEVHRKMARECRYLEYVVLQFVKQDDEPRAELAAEHMGDLFVRVSNVLRPALEQARDTMTAHYDEWRGAEIDVSILQLLISPFQRVPYLVLVGYLTASPGHARGSALLTHFSA